MLQVGVEKVVAKFVIGIFAIYVTLYIIEQFQISRGDIHIHSFKRSWVRSLVSPLIFLYSFGSSLCTIDLM